MELPRRSCGDEMLRPGEMTALRDRLRQLAPQHDLSSVVAYAFDHRTRMLPFIYGDTKMAPAGVRAIGSALADIGCPKTRVVLGQWNKNFRPSQMRLDGEIPDLFLVSSLRLHSASCHAMIRDAWKIEPERRPLIIAGGPHTNYEPWDVFATDADAPWGADLAVTGEEFVFLSLLEVLLETRAKGESIRSAFLRARDSGALDDIPGLVYARTDRRGVPVELVDTGIQRLLGELDELPDPVLGFQLLEPPGKSAKLAPRALEKHRVRKHARVASLVMTCGCKFRCTYCPIPAYNQYQYRAKSPERISAEMRDIYDNYDIRLFFGADDNFFNDRERAVEIAEELARNVDAGSRAHSKICWATEATIHDTLRMDRDQLDLFRKAGLRALWLGVEDITASLVKKGQNKDKTLQAFHNLRDSGIFPVPMLMHHDEQPLVSVGSSYGLLNQLQLLRNAGAVYMQVLMLVPATGSKQYQECYTSGLAYERVNGVEIEPRMVTGNYVVASRAARPWIKQLNLLVAYLFFFNPLRMLVAAAWPNTRVPHVSEGNLPEGGRRDDRRSAWKKFRRRIGKRLGGHFADAGIQCFGMWGFYHTVRRTLGWCYHLMRGNIQRHSEAPKSQLPMRSVDGGRASHALDGTPQLIAGPALPGEDVRAA